MIVDFEMNPTFELAYRFLMETDQSLFVTGNAGTGKTYFLNHIRSQLHKNMVVAAPTGVAAINAKGVTLHSLFQLPRTPFIPTDQGRADLLAQFKHNKQKQKLLKAMDLLVIDEISMVRCDVIDAIDTLLKRVRQRHDTPFGGVQVLMLGDLHQLPPVARQQEWEFLSPYYSSPYFFAAHALKDLNPVMVEFTKVYRQQDRDFITLLNQVRNQTLNEEGLTQLNRRYQPHFKPVADDQYITLTSHNTQADRKNQAELEALKQPKTTYHATIEGDFPEWQYPNDAALTLCEGAQVMFLKNDASGRFYNGKIGVIVSCEDDYVIVRCDDELIDLSAEKWENTQYEKGDQKEVLVQKIIGSYTQIPLRLAWAITIHKSQGLTFDRVMIDAGMAFTSGQVYVALSRCRSLEGIVLLSKIPQDAIYVDHRIASGYDFFKRAHRDEALFKNAKTAFAHKCIDGLYDVNDALKLLEKLIYELKKHYERFPSDALTWTQDIRQQLMDLQVVARKFSVQIGKMLEEHSHSEDPAIEKRISDASAYFLPRFQAIATLLANHPLKTEHKEASVKVTEYLTDLNADLSIKLHLLENCGGNFTIQSYYQSKQALPSKHQSLLAYDLDSKPADADDGSHSILYNRLLKWRNAICQATGKPIYVVANKTCLESIVSILPKDDRALLTVNGMGEAKVKLYGREIIDIVEQYCNEFGVAPPQLFQEPKKQTKPKKVKEEHPEKTPSNKVTLAHFQSGQSVEEIMETRQLARSTIESHLYDNLKEGVLQAHQLIDVSVLEKVELAIKELPKSTTIKELKNFLPDSISYFQIQVAVNYLQNNPVD